MEIRAYWQVALVALAAMVIAAGCVSVSGTVSEQGAGVAAAPENATPSTFRVRATTTSGALYETETDDGGHFTLMLPPNFSYVIGFEHSGGMMDGEMHFSGSMVFGCGAGESDHFFISGRERAIDLGTVAVQRDGSFARPGRNPLDQMDRDRDGIPDARDPDMHCVDAGDGDHDGFYDDDMDHDGFHDDDMDHDGHGDCEMGGMGHDDAEYDCPGPGMTQAPMRTPSAPTRTPRGHMTPGR